MPNFNSLAGSYDLLKRVVFGNRIEEAAMYFLEDLPENSRILIVGGGTGQVLKQFRPSHQITYLELSGAMIRIAEKVDTRATVMFTEADLLTWSPKEKFDIIITPFLLDCFTETHLHVIFKKLKRSLDGKGSWVQTDFYPKNIGQKLLVKMMYSFFNVVANLKTKTIADFDNLFKRYDFRCERKASFFHSMIESKIYRHIE